MRSPGAPAGATSPVGTGPDVSADPDAGSGAPAETGAAPGPGRRSLLVVGVVGGVAGDGAGVARAPRRSRGAAHPPAPRPDAARLAAGLRTAGYRVRVVADAAAAEAELAIQPYDLVLYEPSPIGAAVAASIAESPLPALCRHGATVIALVQRGALQKDGVAAALIAAGAYDCVGLPCDAGDIVCALSKAAAREERLGDRAAVRFLPTDTSGAGGQAARPGASGALTLPGRGPGIGPGSGFIATAPRMRELLAQLARVAPHPTGVLLTGESGTGKELLARAVHALSPRRDGPFLAVNCGALPETLLESLLFGHVRGAFTDAVRDQAGVFAQASGGTLFLDEVGELPASLQVKLLRVLQERMVLPLGAQTAIAVDVRLVAATLRDLEADVASGRFRADLYYRLSIVPLTVPPLRERPQDILPLAHHFCRRASARLRLPVAGITPAAERALCAYDWPGNVRELENTIERAAVLCDSTLIDLPDLPPELIAGKAAALELRVHADDLSIKQVTRRIEIALIQRALIKTRGNRTAAAKLLELSHRALLYKLREYKLG
jgi:two-component system response regulator AtoC